MILIAIFIFGLLIGSFLNVLILRHNTGETVIKGSSKCFSCGKKLKWQELIPVLSFVFQKGRCKKCGSKISLQYILIELLTAVIFVFIYEKIAGFYEGGFLNSIQNFQLFYYPFKLIPDIQDAVLIIIAWIFFSILIAISVYDARHKIIPNAFSLALAAAGLIYTAASFYKFKNAGIIFDNILSGVVFSLIFLSISFVSKEKWMGYGDGKLAFSLGIFLGPLKSGLAALFSFWIGTVFGIIILILSRKKTSLKSEVPFAPFLAAGAFLAFLLEGDTLIKLVELSSFIYSVF